MSEEKLKNCDKCRENGKITISVIKRDNQYFHYVPQYYEYIDFPISALTIDDLRNKTIYPLEVNCNHR